MFPKDATLARAAGTLAAAMFAAFAVTGLAGCAGSPPVSAIELVAEDREFEDQKTDTKIKAGILTDINNRMGTSYAALLNVDVYEQRVMLTGEVETAEVRAKAGRLARGIEGVTSVINEIQVVPADADKGSAVDDLVIAEKLELKLASTQGVSHTNWRVRAVNGTVYLFGRSLSAGEMERVVGIARDTEDVRKVVNHAVVRGT